MKFLIHTEPLPPLCQSPMFELENGQFQSLHFMTLLDTKGNLAQVRLGLVMKPEGLHVVAQSLTGVGQSVQTRVVFEPADKE